MPDIDKPIEPGDRDGYDAIPDYILEYIRDYVKTGRRGGDFMDKLMSGDYMGALGFADDAVQSSFSKIMRFLYNRVPQSCFGSKLKRDIWTCLGGEKNHREYLKLLDNKTHMLSKEVVHQVGDIIMKHRLQMADEVQSWMDVQQVLIVEEKNIHMKGFRK